MRLDVDTINDTVRIALSRRNMAAMVAKLAGDPPTSMHMILSDTGCFDGWTLVFIGESDDMHYGNRPQKPGVMHAATEEALQGIATTGADLAETIALMLLTHGVIASGDYDGTEELLLKLLDGATVVP